MGEGHFQNEGQAILLYYAPQFENVPTLGLYSTLLSLDLGSTKILFFSSFFPFPPLIRGYLQHFKLLLLFFLVLMTTTPWAFPGPIFVTHRRMEAKKIVSTMDGPILYIWLWWVSSPSCSHHWFQCTSPTLSLLFPLPCKLQLLFRLPIAKRKYTLPVKTKGFKKITSPPFFMFKIYFPLEIIMLCLEME